jgi:hypothetical protein
MKKLYTLLALVLTLITNAQIPQGFNYQATVRNSSGALIVNQNVNFKFNVLQNSAIGTIVYSENQTATTDDLGHIALVVGQGTATTGTFSSINWGTGNYYLRIELNTGSGYVDLGSTQLLSVPYALYANSSGNSQSTPNLASVLAVNNGANNLQIKNLADPTDAKDAVTMSYLATQIAALQAQITAISTTAIISPTFRAYIFAEPQTSSDDTTLLDYAIANGAIDWGNYYSGTVPNNSGGNYNNDLNVYAHQPSFINGGGNFVTPLTLSAPILQSSGTYSGCSHNIYTFPSIPIIPSINVNPSIQYFYSIWIPLAGVGGTFNNMSIDLGTTSCGSGIYSGIQPVSTLATINVVVTSGAAIPAGTYRVLWLSPNLILPPSLPLGSTYYFRGNTKS